MKLYELEKWANVELAPNDIWEFNWLDWMYWKWVKWNEFYIAVRAGDKLTKKSNWIYIVNV